MGRRWASEVFQAPSYGEAWPGAPRPITEPRGAVPSTGWLRGSFSPQGPAAMEGTLSPARKRTLQPSAMDVDCVEKVRFRLWPRKIRAVGKLAELRRGG